MVKFKVTSRPIGGEDTSYVETKLRTDTAKFTNMRIAGFTQSIIALIIERLRSSSNIKLGLRAEMYSVRSCIF